MSAITTRDVRITRRDPQLTGGVIIQADVRGRQRKFVVDFNPAWSVDQWWCSCGKPRTCPHVRAVKAAIA